MLLCQRRIHLREAFRMIQAVVRIVAPDEKRSEAMEVLRSLKEPTEVSRGCLGCRILQDVDNRYALTCVEYWETLEDLEQHIRSERFRRLLPYIDMSVEPPEVEFDRIDKIHGIEFVVDTLTSRRG